jgi:hypothetical protein
MPCRLVDRSRSTPTRAREEHILNLKFKRRANSSSQLLFIPIRSIRPPPLGERIETVQGSVGTLTTEEMVRSRHTEKEEQERSRKQHRIEDERVVIDEQVTNGEDVRLATTSGAE